MTKDMGICAVCYGTSPFMHVHHLYYEFNKEPWEYPDDAYLTLCDWCHQEEHDRLARYVGPPRDMSLKKLGFMAKDFEDMAITRMMVDAGLFPADKMIPMYIEGIKRRQLQYQYIIERKIKDVSRALNSE